MKNNKKILLIILILIIAIIIGIFVFKKNPSNYSEISIQYSDLSVVNGNKDVTITDEEVIKKITGMCKNLENATDQNVSTTIIHNYVVTLGNGTTIYMDSTIYNYGYVKYKNSEKLEFIKLPDGLLDYIKEVVTNS